MSEQIQVILRFLPCSPGVPKQVTIEGNNECQLEGQGPQRIFTYDRVFSPDRTQEDVFNTIGRGTTKDLLKGYNTTLLAYGQTGSGKTHSMFGAEGGRLEGFEVSSPLYPHRGLIPRLFEDIFQSLEDLPKEEMAWKVEISAFELYREEINDLLAPKKTSSPNDYRIREDTVDGKGVYIENLKSVQITSLQEAYDALRVMVSSRAVGATNMNSASSRSHSIMMVTIEQESRVQEGSKVRARLNLVDLAGSEKVNKTGAEGDRLKEAQMINLSLTLLGNVINKLTDGRSTHIPYRDSKLTRILQDSLGGNARTTLMCHASMHPSNIQETTSTLLFASRAKRIQNKPRVNKELTPGQLAIAYAKAMDEIKILKQRLALTSSHSPSKASGSPTETLMNGLIEDVDGGDRAPDGDPLHEKVDSLLRELEEVRGELFDKAQELQQQRQMIEFYKRKQRETDKKIKENTEEDQQTWQDKFSQEQKAVEFWKRKYAALEQGLAGDSRDSPRRPSRGSPPVPGTPTPSAPVQAPVRRTLAMANRPQSAGARAKVDTGLHLVAGERPQSAQRRRDILNGRLPKGMPTTGTAAAVRLQENKTENAGSDVLAAPHHAKLAPMQNITAQATGHAMAIMKEELQQTRLELLQATASNEDSRGKIAELKEEMDHQSAEVQKWKQEAAEKDAQIARLQEMMKQAMFASAPEPKKMQYKSGDINADHSMRPGPQMTPRFSAVSVDSLSASKVETISLRQSVDHSVAKDFDLTSDAKNIGDKVAMELLVRKEEFMDLENDVYEIESGMMDPDDEAELKDSVSQRLIAAQNFCSEASRLLESCVGERHHKTLTFQIQDLSEKATSLTRRMENPNRSGTRRYAFA